MLRALLIAFCVLLTDQVSKWLVVTRMNLFESFPVIDHFFYITSHRNRGAAFGIMQNQQWLFVLMSALVMVGIVVFLYKSRHTKSFSYYFITTCLACILGGAMGNLLDRIRMESVVDFLDFRFGTYAYPIFNVADSAVVVGALMLAIYTLFFDAESTKEKEEMRIKNVE